MCCLQHVHALLVSFPGEKANAAEPGRGQFCNTTVILPRRTRIAEGEKRQKDSPPASLRFASPRRGENYP